MAAYALRQFVRKIIIVAPAHEFPLFGSQDTTEQCPRA
jgi:hypothetical protein